MTGAIKAMYDLGSELLDRRAARRQRERLLHLRGSLRKVQSGRPAPLVFSEEYLHQLALEEGTPSGDIPVLLYELEREGFLVSFFGGYTLVERWGGPAQLF